MDRLNVDVNAYVPRWVRTALGKPRFSNGEPAVESGAAAVLLLDIAGFVELTNQFARRGPVGAEEISNLLNRCFGSLTDIVHDHGGDVIAFAGDSILAMWGHAFAIDQASHLAAQCGLALRKAMSEQAMSGDHRLRQRISAETGEIYCANWAALAVNGSSSSPGPRLSAWAKHTAKRGSAISCCAASYGGRSRRVAKGRSPTACSFSTACRAEDFSRPMRFSRSNAMSRSKSLVPKVVVDHLRLEERNWLAEFRNITIVSINLNDVDFRENFFDRLQRATLEIQSVVHRYDGFIYNVIMDDKGFSIMVAFGLSGLAHEDDPQRGIETGLAISKTLGAAAVAASIGIASGKLFCGDYGGEDRRQYCLIGPAINTAARLMQLAGGGVLCDAATAKAAEGRVDFAVLPPQQIKGSDGPVAVFRPIAVSAAHRGQGGSEIVGRDDERRKLREALQSHRGGVFIIQGEPGIGKSVLLDDLADFAGVAGFRALRGFAASIDKSTPYFAWRSVIHQLAGSDSPEQVYIFASEKVKGDEKLATWLPLLREIVNINRAETDLTLQIAGSARADCIEALTVALLADCEQIPSALVFEDLHWFDSASNSSPRGRRPAVASPSSGREPSPTRLR